MTGGSQVRDHTYVYDVSNRLTNIRNSAEATVVGRGYDVQGNLANKNGKTYTFDYGNRLRGTHEEWYRYDGHGRRVLNWRATEPGTLSMYGQSGQLFYDENYRAADRKATEYVYLAGSLITTRARNVDSGAWTVSFHHTDALGSPVATTNPSAQVIDRTNWEPYGAAINKPAYDGIGFTGHVMDGATGLTYMQQRYYDPVCGCFLSVDPVTAYSNPVGQFHRYRYANSNPYRYIDPDGRAGRKPWRKAEDAVIEEISERLAKDGIEVLRQVGISTVLEDGTRVNAVADYAYRIGDKLHFGEVKFGPEAKFSINQKAVYSAIEKGRVSVSSPVHAKALNVAAGVLFRGADITLHATEGSRAMRQFARIASKGIAKTLVMAGSAPVTAADLFFHTEDVSEFGRMGMDCTVCMPAATYQEE